jgi:hypothetical protein
MNARYQYYDPEKNEAARRDHGQFHAAGSIFLYPLIFCGPAGAYARLEFANTHYLSYRDLRVIISKHVAGTRSVDFGCHAGTSQSLMGFEMDHS